MHAIFIYFILHLFRDLLEHVFYPIFCGIFFQAIGWGVPENGVFGYCRNGLNTSWTHWTTKTRISGTRPITNFITVVILFTKVVHNLKSTTTRLKWNEVMGTMLYLKCAILLPYLLLLMITTHAEIKKRYPRNLLGTFFYCFSSSSL